MTTIIDLISRIGRERTGAILVLVFCMIYGWSISDIPLPAVLIDASFTPRTLPTFLTAFGLLVCLAIIFSKPADSTGDSDQPASKAKPISSKQITQFVALLSLMSFYGFTIRPFGFLLATVIFMVAGFSLLGEKRLWPTLFIASCLAGSFWALMRFGLDVYVAPWPTWVSV